MTLQIELGFETPPQEAVSLELVYGQLRIRVDDVCLTEHRGDPQSEVEWVMYDLDGDPVDDGQCDFVGGHLNIMLSQLREAVLALARGEDDEFEQLSVPTSISGVDRFAFVLSRIDERHVRLSYQLRLKYGDDGRQPTLAAARGYAVSLADLCAGMADAIETYCEYLQRAIPALEAEGQRARARATIDEAEPAIEELRTHEARYS